MVADKYMILVCRQEDVGITDTFVTRTKKNKYI